MSLREPYKVECRPSKLKFQPYTLKMGEAARVYAEQLQRYRHGHPLWWPEHTQGPNGRKREIDIGDVGYIDSDGAFHPLFNVTYPADDERNAGSLPADDFVPLRYSTSAIEIKENFLAPGPVHSQSVTSRSVDVGLAAHVTSLFVQTQEDLTSISTLETAKFSTPLE